MSAASSPARRAVRCIVGGRVQGVFYRAAAAQLATRLALHGWVRNLEDGRVEVVAIGSTEALTELASWLWQGPPAARVDSVHVEEWTGAEPSEFAVRR